MITAMAVMCDFFGAPSDEAAAQLVDIGPGDPPASPTASEHAWPPGWRVYRRENRPKLRTSTSGILVVSTTDIHPGTHAVTLEELLTGEDFETIGDRPRCCQALAEHGDMFVLTMTDELQAALATATITQLVTTSLRWSRDEIYGDSDTEERAHLLFALADLARQTHERGEHLYAWASSDAVRS